MTVRPIRETNGSRTDLTSRGGELGVTSPRRVGSTLYEDFIVQLRGRRAERVYEEMAWNDATIGGILYTIEQLVRQVDWTVESDDDETREFLAENIDGLEHSWDDFIAAALSMIVYGWSMFEIVYEMRDARLWWTKFAFRNQDTLLEWELDAVGNLLAFVQAGRGGSRIPIPAEPVPGFRKLVHFRTTTSEGRPEGRSWLRRAYRAWYIKKRVEDYAAIGAERDMNGMPHAQIPTDIINAGDGNEAFDYWKKTVTGLKVDELQGLITPLEYDESGNKLYEFGLLAPSGRSKIDVLALIRMQAQDIAGVMAAQFVSLGRDTVGSRALAEPQQEVFQTALGALLDTIEETLHRQATAPLLELNNLPSGRIVHGELRDLDLDGFSNMLVRTAQAGADLFDDEGETEDEVRQMMGLSPRQSVIIEDENISTGTRPAQETEA